MDEKKKKRHHTQLFNTSISLYNFHSYVKILFHSSLPSTKIEIHELLKIYLLLTEQRWYTVFILPYIKSNIWVSLYFIKPFSFILQSLIEKVTIERKKSIVLKWKRMKLLPHRRAVTRPSTFFQHKLGFLHLWAKVLDYNALNKTEDLSR